MTLPQDSAPAACVGYCKQTQNQESIEHSLNCLTHKKKQQEPLFAQTIRWIDSHSKRIGVKFVELPTCVEPTHKVRTGSLPMESHSRPSKTIIFVSLKLTEILELENDSSYAIGAALSTL